MERLYREFGLTSPHRQEHAGRTETLRLLGYLSFTPVMRVVGARHGPPSRHISSDANGLAILAETMRSAMHHGI
jgi:hypothetical protein